MFDLNWPSRYARLYARIVRMLLTIVSLVLVATPWTQQAWTWDGFLRGGQDFETCVLLIAVSLCLIPVLVRACKQHLELLLSVCYRLRWKRPARGHRSAPRHAWTRAFEFYPPGPPADSMQLPLLI